MTKIQTEQTATTAPKHCFAHSHMTMREYGLYTRIRELQSKFGFAFFDGDALAKSFQKTNRSTVYLDCKALIKAGWFEVQTEAQGERDRKIDGTYKSRQIVALNHKEWAAKYPSGCQNLKDSQSISKTGPVCPNGTVQSISKTDQSISKTDQCVLMNKDLIESRHDIRQTQIKADLVGGEPKNGDVFLDSVPPHASNQEGVGSAEIAPNTDAKDMVPSGTPQPPAFKDWVKSKGIDPALYDYNSDRWDEEVSANLRDEYFTKYTAMWEAFNATKRISSALLAEKNKFEEALC